jgi:uncharacterized protein YqjF (DUF2071 family)
VRCRGESGIYFLAEWLGSRINLKLGPPTYGLPYRLGALRYQYNEVGHAQGEIRDRVSNRHVRFEACIGKQFAPAPAGSIDEFLVERYTCFTEWRGLRRFFRIWHPEWPRARVEIRRFERDLLLANWPWMRDARIVSANYSPGLRNVWLGRPHLLKAEPRSAFLKLP